MDVFDLRDQVIDDYANYVQSFLRIGDAGIKDYVDAQFGAGRLWPDPLVQLNPSFAPGGTIDELVADGVLAEECRRIFRRDKDDDDPGKPLRLHRHQQEAIGAAGAVEACEAACYNCLLSYTNQREHAVLDRHAIKDWLMLLAGAETRAGGGNQTREGAREALLARCASELERRFVRFLDAGGYRLPDRAQPLLAEYGTRPDFYYDGTQACVYVDGPYHDYPERHARDREVAARLRDGGYDVVRVAAEESWAEAIERLAWVFGVGERRVVER